MAAALQNVSSVMQVNSLSSKVAAPHTHEAGKFSRELSAVGPGTSVAVPLKLAVGSIGVTANTLADHVTAVSAIFDPAGISGVQPSEAAVLYLGSEHFTGLTRAAVQTQRSTMHLAMNYSEMAYKLRGPTLYP